MKDIITSEMLEKGLIFLIGFALGMITFGIIGGKC
jgi:hypothetical protein